MQFKNPKPWDVMYNGYLQKSQEMANTERDHEATQKNSPPKWEFFCDDTFYPQHVLVRCFLQGCTETRLKTPKGRGLSNSPEADTLAEYHREFD